MNPYDYELAVCNDGPSAIRIRCPDCRCTCLLPDAAPDREYWCPWCGNEMPPPTAAEGGDQDRAA